MLALVELTFYQRRQKRNNCINNKIPDTEKWYKEQ